MADQRDDLVELVGDDRELEPATSIDRSGERPRPGAVDWWLSLDVLERSLGLAALITLVVAACVSVSAAHQHHRVDTVTRQVVVENPVPGVDALGCPVSTTCTVRELPALVTRVQRLVPALGVVYASEVDDEVTGRVYRREVFGLNRNDELSVVRLISACVPGGTGNASDISAITQPYTRPPGGGFGAPFRTRMTAVRDGCFGYVSYRASRAIGAGGPRSMAALLDLVVDPAVAVHR